MSNNILSTGTSGLYLPPRIDKRSPEERERDNIAFAASAARYKEQRERLVVKMHQDDFEPGELKCRDCPCSFSSRSNLFKHMTKQHRTKVVTIKGRSYKVGRCGANTRYYEKKKADKALLTQESKMMAEAVVTTRAKILRTLFVDFDEELAKLPGGKPQMIRDARKYHMSNYYDDMAELYSFVRSDAKLPDTYYSRHAILTIVLDFLHLVFPSNIKKNYKHDQVMTMLLGHDKDDLPEDMVLGEVDDSFEDKIRAFLFQKKNKRGTACRFLMTKATIELLHRCFEANDYVYSSVRSNALFF
ncbi:uncharacterized protein EV154DRAFT_534762 [Mucor mucedo]|uniref:uncharacterized protein n=1 Tax=Mucor mucedo TaxID=29922 RepID=UPI00221E3996|nr:uncharacterized protein EV154DRAFT_534762 [Mucor mucedo]KAI7863292.1 hypothetical protein EV154DRAFT_534762 [Mucor mucedo]